MDTIWQSSHLIRIILILGIKTSSRLHVSTCHRLFAKPVVHCSGIQIGITHYVGELGWELHLESSDVSTVYDALCSAGEYFNLVNFGSYALNAMRLEKAYHAWGAVFGTVYTMFDAG